MDLKDDNTRDNDSRWTWKRARFVKVQCQTTKKETIIRVPVTDQTKTCIGAIAWTFGEEENNYNPIKET